MTQKEMIQYFEKEYGIMTILATEMFRRLYMK